jgi:hypothetical protein
MVDIKNERSPEETDVSDLLGDAPSGALNSGNGADRRSRDLELRGGVEDRGLDGDEDEKFALFAQTLFNDVLPDIPPIPGFHVCWLSTTHQADSIPRRLRLGYTPIKPEEIPGFEHATLKSGEYTGFIGVNEMVAFKIPMSLYLRFMEEVHHTEPARQVQAIAAQIDSQKASAERDGGRVEEDEGMEEIRRSAPPRGRFTG